MCEVISAHAPAVGGAVLTVTLWGYNTNLKIESREMENGNVSSLTIRVLALKAFAKHTVMSMYHISAYEPRQRYVAAFGQLQREREDAAACANGAGARRTAGAQSRACRGESNAVVLGWVGGGGVVGRRGSAPVWEIAPPSCHLVIRPAPASPAYYQPRVHLS
jgi:hypothetical protein